MDKVLNISKYVGAFMVIQTGLGFIAKPFLDDYIDSHIEAYKEEEGKKESLRSLLAPKMDIDEDEIHIEIGRMYKDEEKVRNEIKEIKKEIKYYHPSTILK